MSKLIVQLFNWKHNSEERKLTRIQTDMYKEALGYKRSLIVFTERAQRGLHICCPHNPSTHLETLQHLLIVIGPPKKMNRLELYHFKSTKWFQCHSQVHFISFAWKHWAFKWHQCFRCHKSCQAALGKRSFRSFTRVSTSAAASSVFWQGGVDLPQVQGDQLLFLAGQTI